MKTSNDLVADVFPTTLDDPAYRIRTDVPSHPHTVNDAPDWRVVRALRRHILAEEQYNETVAVCEAAGHTALSLHPLGRAIVEAGERSLMTDGHLWEALCRDDRWRVVVDGDWFAYVETKGPRDGRERPRVVWGRVDSDHAPQCVRSYVENRRFNP